jgi:pectate lyase
MKAKHLRILLLNLISLLLWQNASAALWFEDGITNAVGSNLGAAAPYSGGNARIIITSGNLAYPGLADPAPAGNQFTITGGTSSGKSYLTITASAITSGSVYYAFLVQCTTLPTSEKVLTSLLTTASVGGSTDALAVYTKPSGANYVLGLRKNGVSTTFAASPMILSLNTTYLVVVKYTFNTGSGTDDAGSLYINPAPVGTEPATPEVTLTGGTDATGIQFCGWINQSGGNGTWLFDTLRVGSTWTDVTQSGGSVAPTPAPVITQTLLVPQGLILRGTNGPASSPYQVLASTNLALPATNWPAISTNAFDGGGHFDSTNPVAPGLARQFFRLLVGGALPPSITTQPRSQTVAVNADATFTVIAAGTGPLTYRWFFNTNTPVGVNSQVFTLSSAQTNDVGTYSVIVTNNFGAITSAFAALTVREPIPGSPQFNLVGFGEGTTGGGVIPDTDPAYRKVYTPLEFCQAIYAANKEQGVKVIEIMNDLDLGWKEIGADAQAVGALTDGSSVVKLHPKLLTTGVSGCYINPKHGGLTIFSANGSAIRHCGWGVKATANIIIRNLKFDEYWEWDEQGKGQYDKNNWDFIALSSGGGTVDHVWIDHCTFTLAYDGLADNKGGVSSVTYSWCKYAGDDGATNPNSFVRQQINALETNMSAYAMYNFLRTRGFSVEDIVQVLQGSKKGTAVGETSLNPVNTNASITFHHNWFNNMWDRHPRLAGGQVHKYNCYVYCTDVLAARRMRDARVAAMSADDQYTMENTYSFKPSINGSISTEDGAMLVEKSVYIDNNYPLRNNQTDPSNPIYTGKIKALDTIYSYLETDGSTTYVRGNSTDPGNPLGPFQDLDIKPFCWNTNAATPNGQLPYTATMDDPAQVQAIVTSPTSGAGAGVLTWAKTNWLKTTY